MILSRFFISIINFFGLQAPLDYQQVALTPVEGHGNGGRPPKPPPPPEPFQPHGALPNPFNPGGEPIKCEYPEMKGYKRTENNISQWLIRKKVPWYRPNYDISTDYETETPMGIVRNYTLVVNASGGHIWDGRELGKRVLFNSTYPGPWIEACWGDILNITVKNELPEKVDGEGPHNGTAIHWHGLRLLNENLVDGVPGITQCPIAPGNSASYTFRARQYGTTWYHSHYSLQYSDGLLGPLTIHGPSSHAFDESVWPIIISDHTRRSAFQEYYREQFVIQNPKVSPPNQESILINDHGSYAGQRPDLQYKLPGKKYLLRLINASTSTTFVFSIDDHKMTVIGTDLVPVHPHETDRVRIGIGQRYHVIVETKKDVDDNSAFWIRTHPSDGCHGFFPGPPDGRQGILWYPPNGNPDDKKAQKRIPETSSTMLDTSCRDMISYKPILEWRVDKPPLIDDESDYDINQATIKLWRWNLTKDNPTAADDRVNYWKALDDHVWVDYSHPSVNTISNNGEFGNHTAVMKAKPSNPNKTVWNYLLIIGGRRERRSRGGLVVPAYHPMHLHGHDFALLKYSTVPYEGLDSIAPHTLNLTNPVRRDTVLLPNDGFILIAFKSDNPGVWALHCHIAWHASAGLALQIVEEPEKLREQLNPNTHGLSEEQKRLIRQNDQTCKDWDAWYKERLAHLKAGERFRDDSGI
ncbi:multicopper oxidase-domain-containing protein [Aspergillus ambiguus]|uniref:multicopper oxidase-domain-containing protein n=1 Tax=Aspergillus ambiguus TaxID=176160 RepID=UPI003CCE1121